MEPTRDELVALHHQAVELLEHKLSRIPARVFPSGRKPTITDIYTRPNSVYNPGIHPKLQLDFVFANYTQFAESGCKARKTKQSMSVTMAIFYWQMDKQHSLSRHHQEIRFNVLLAQIVLKSPTARAEMKPELVRFLEMFVAAWVESALRIEHAEDESRDEWMHKCWKKGKYDLVRWTSKPRSRMAIAVRELEALVPTLEGNYNDFWEKAATLKPEEYKKHGSVWALQSVIQAEKWGQESDQMDRAYEAQESLRSGDFLEGFENMMSMGDDAPAYLSKELFEQPLVEALLTDVDERPLLLDPEENEMWLDPLLAIDLVKGNVEGMDSLGDVFKSMSVSFMQ